MLEDQAVAPRIEADLLVTGCASGRARGHHGLRPQPARPDARRTGRATVTILGLDPGIRTGVKVAVVDATGKVLDLGHRLPLRADATTSRAPCACWRAWSSSTTSSSSAIGNGTGTRETDRLVLELIARIKDRNLHKIVTNEAGASVYSASELASKELPDLDVSLRGAVSIARRVQDPLAELVKIDPKSIGVGQYQHDVSQTHLSRALEGVIEDCVNKVGVDVNTASPALLSRVAGLSPTLATAVVTYRDANGAFQSRKQIQKVPRLGPKAFEQAAGFLRIEDGDGSARRVHRCTRRPTRSCSRIERARPAGR